jgi:hypothetical protein
MENPDPMWGEQAAKVIASFPPLVWALLAAYIVWLLRGTLVTAVRSLSNVEAFGVKITLSGSQAMNAALELARKHPDWDVEVPERLTENELSDFSRLWHDGCGEAIIEAQDVDRNHSRKV